MSYQLMGDFRTVAVNKVLNSTKNTRYLVSWTFKIPSYTSVHKLITLDNLLLPKQVR